MNKRSKLAALLGAGLLTFSVASIALADTLNTSFTSPHTIGGMTVGTADECASEFPALGSGEVGLQFNLGGADQNDGTLDATFTNPAGTAHKDNADANNGN